LESKNLPDEHNWNEFWQANNSSQFTKKSRSKTRIIHRLEPLIKPQMTVLDAGCGSGFFSNYFIRRGCRVYALDYSKDALIIAEKLTGLKAEAYLNLNLLDAGLGAEYKNKFDIIFSDGLLEHFNKEQQLQIIENFKEMKKSSGMIATFVPNKYSWWQVIRPLFMPGIKEKPLTMKALIELHAGLDLIDKGGLNVLPLSFSPDKILGSRIGMLIYTFTR